MVYALAGGLMVTVAAAAVFDLRTRRIPNVLTAGMSGIGLALAATGVSGVSPAAAMVS